MATTYNVQVAKSASERIDRERKRSERANSAPGCLKLSQRSLKEATSVLISCLIRHWGSHCCRFLVRDISNALQLAFDIGGVGGKNILGML